MKKVIAIDYGDARIGLAISDERHIVALPLETIQGSNSTQISAKLVSDFLKKRLSEIGEIVVGLPLDLKGKESQMSAKVREFAKHLEELLHLPISFIDERLSSASADRSLKEIGLKRKKRTKQLDTAAAVFLLQCYLEQKYNGPV